MRGPERFDRECRFLLHDGEMRRFLAGVRPYLSLDVYDPVRPVSYTRTTYLDTADLAYLRSSDDEVVRQLRLREYASASYLDRQPTATGQAFLELKESAGALRSKVRFALDRDLLLRVHHAAATEMWGVLASALPAASAWRTSRNQEVMPRLTSWYRRSSMSGEDGRVRITLDDEITFCRPAPPAIAGESVGPTHPVGHAPGRVLEVKVQGELPEWLREAVGGALEARSFSKYRYGMSGSRPESAGESPALVAWVA